MKILILINSLGTGGAEKLVVETIPLLIKNGIEVELLVLKKLDSIFNNQLENAKLCKIHYLTEKSVYNPFLTFKIIPFLKKYDLIHVHLFPSLYWTALAKMISFSKIKLVFTEHSTNNRRQSVFFYKIIDRLLYNQYQRIVAISDSVTEKIKLHLKFKSKQFVTINNGINLDNIKNAEICKDPLFKKDNSQKFIFQFSSFQYPKNQKILIRALLKLPDNFYIFFVGSGILIDECKAYVKELELKNKVFFLGIRSDVPSLLKTADYIVLSSRYEGLSLASIEGMASGKPFIASDVPGLTEVVTGAGLLFPQGDYQALANHILKLDSDADFYNQTVQNCLHRASDFDIQIMVQKHLELYKTL